MATLKNKHCTRLLSDSFFVCYDSLGEMIHSLGERRAGETQASAGPAGTDSSSEREGWGACFVSFRLLDLMGKT